MITAVQPETDSVTASPAIWCDHDADFPSELRDIESPPAVLWTLGERPTLDAPRVAVVGTRDMTAYGERVTRKLAGALARAGACVVSGMARGVDATAHRTALEIGGRTVAVLGTGVDVAYPLGHRRLHADIARAGLVISEMEPGTRAGPGCFPRRNRIIAGLARVVIVVEAGFRSGANNTVAHALTYGRLVGVVPGPIDAPKSQGCNQLLHEGAHPITCVNDALALMDMPQEAEDRPTLPASEQKIWDVLTGEGAATVELIAARTALPLREALTALTSMELEGLIACDLTGAFRLS